MVTYPPAFIWSVPRRVELAPKLIPLVSSTVTLVSKVIEPLENAHVLRPAIATVPPVTLEVIVRAPPVAKIFPPLLFSVNVRPFKSSVPAFTI